MREQHLGHSDRTAPPTIISETKAELSLRFFYFEKFYDASLVIVQQRVEVLSVTAPDCRPEAFLKPQFLPLNLVCTFGSLKLVVEESKWQVTFPCNLDVISFEEFHYCLENT